MVPLNDLSRQYVTLKAEYDTALHRIMAKGLFTLGPEVTAFERDFAEYLNIYHAVGVASGTDALTIAVKALGLTTEDEVMLPANAYPTAFGVALSGVRITLADVLPDGTINPLDVSKRLTARTRAVVPVHLYGNLADVPEIRDRIHAGGAKRFLVEDAAQAHGAMVRDGSSWRKAGTLGDIGIFSFYPTKNLGALGDGGAVVTDRSGLYHTLLRLRMYGEEERYKSQEVAGVTRLDEIQAAILSVKLRYLDMWNKRRKELAEFYSEQLDSVGDITIVNQVNSRLSKTDSKKKKTVLSRLTLQPANRERFRPSFHLFVIRTKQRDTLQKYLLENGVGTGIHYPIPVHLTKAFAHLGYKKGDFPGAEAQCEEVLSLPIFPDLTDREAEKVVATVKHFFS